MCPAPAAEPAAAGAAAPLPAPAPAPAPASGGAPEGCGEAQSAPPGGRAPSPLHEGCRPLRSPAEAAEAQPTG